MRGNEGSGTVVIPAKAGIHFTLVNLDSRVRGNDERRLNPRQTGRRSTSCSAAVKKLRRYQSATTTDVTATAPASMNTTTIW